MHRGPILISLFICLSIIITLGWLKATHLSTLLIASQIWGFHILFTVRSMGSRKQNFFAFTAITFPVLPNLSLSLNIVSQSDSHSCCLQTTPWKCMCGFTAFWRKVWAETCGTLCRAVLQGWGNASSQSLQNGRGGVESWTSSTRENRGR